MAAFDFIKPQQPIIWPNVIAIFIYHIIAPYSLFVHSFQFHCFTWVWTILCLFYSNFSVTAGVHRLWAHRSFKVKTPLKIALLIGYAMSHQLTVRNWVRNHRVHHKFSDTDADPHNIKRGFFFAHMGWLMQRKHPDVRQQQDKIDMSDITNDPLIAFHDKYFFIWKLLFAHILTIYIPVYFWNESLFLAFAANTIRLSIHWNSAWAVNSVAHTWGNKPYNKKIQPVDSTPYMNIFVFGEGWHNYHHQFPWDYKASELNHWIFNFTTMLLEFFSKLGWVYDMKTASPSLVAKTIMKHGDGSHPIHSHGQYLLPTDTEVPEEPEEPQ